LLSEVARLSEQAADFETILSDMALYLHRMAVAQVLPDAVDNALGDREQVVAQAARLAAEDVQLYYQIAIKSQEDLPLAPDARSGFEMALIRMVAFAPQGVPSEKGNPLPSQAAPLETQAGNQAASEQASSQASEPVVEDDEAKKKALTEVPAAAQSQSPSVPVSQEGYDAAPEPVVDAHPSVAPSQAFSPEAQSPIPETQSYGSEPQANSMEPQLVKFSPPSPRSASQTQPAVAQEPQQAASPAPEAGATVQNARASLGGGLRTVQFPSASAERLAQAEARASQSNVTQTASASLSYAPVSEDSSPQPTAPGSPSDVPPWEELPVMP
ncbi:hypothetical protein ABMA58_17230, partial [Oceanospirillum sp. HFRX-1_2]